MMFYSLRLTAWLLGGMLLLSAGCARGLVPEYGQTKGTSGNKGINGFGTLRKSFEANGWKARDVTRLSERLQSLDAMVWIPTTHEGADGAAVRWLHDWLGDKPRTLIYILPDEGNEVRYWEQARALAPPQQRLEYRRRHARAITELMNGPYGGNLDDTEQMDRLWFKASMLRDPRPRWKILPHSTVVNAAPPGVGVGTGPFTVTMSSEWSEDGYDLGDSDLQLQPFITSTDGKPLVVRIFTPKRPATAKDDGDGDLKLLMGDEAAEVTSGEDLEPEVDPALLAEMNEEWSEDQWTEDGEWIDPAEAQLRARRRSGYGIGDSEIIVIAGGSLVSNFGMATDEGRAIAKRLLAESSKRADPTKPRIGFITSSYAGVPVSDPSDKPQMATGMEWLTVWPLSIITIHLALMGIIACIVLFPIFGRPRKLRERSNSDFADHINAVAALLHRSNGEHYARQRISEYFRKVRGETAGPWVMPLPVTVAPPVKPAIAPTATTQADTDSANTETSLDAVSSEPKTLNLEQSPPEPKNERNEP